MSDYEHYEYEGGDETVPIKSSSSVSSSILDDITIESTTNNVLSTPLLSTEERHLKDQQQEQHNHRVIHKEIWRSTSIVYGTFSCLFGLITSVFVLTTCHFVKLNWNEENFMVLSISHIGLYQYAKDNGECYSYDSIPTYATHHHGSKVGSGDGEKEEETFFPDAMVARVFGILASVVGGLMCIFMVACVVKSSIYPKSYSPSQRQMQSNSSSNNKDNNIMLPKHQGFVILSIMLFLSCIFEGLTFLFLHQENGVFCKEYHSKCVVSSGSISAIFAIFFYFISGVIFTHQYYVAKRRRRI